MKHCLLINYLVQRVEEGCRSLLVSQNHIFMCLEGMNKKNSEVNLNRLKKP